MEDARVEHDGTVRNAGGEIMQFSYGGDGWDAEKVERVRVAVSALPRLRKRLGKAYFDLHVKPALPSLKGREVVDMYVPADVRCLARYHSGTQLPTTELSVELAQQLGRAFGVDATQMLRLHVLLHLPLLQEEEGVCINYCSLLDALERRCHRARIVPGSMVGAISAVSLGEPCTQVRRSSE